MESWLYGLLTGLGTASLILAALCIFSGPAITATAESNGWKIIGIVILSFIPILLITGIVLLSISLSVGGKI